MQKTLWIILAALIAAIGAPNAHADTITDGAFGFTVDGIGPPSTQFLPSGSFVYDNSTNQFTSFTVMWHGVSFDFTTAANGFTDPGAVGCAGAPAGNAFYVDLICNVNASGLGEWNAGAINNPTGLADFQFEVSHGVEPPIVTVATAVTPTPENVGDYSLTLVTSTPVANTPEPGGFTLIVLGIGTVFVMWKCLARGHEQPA